MPRKTKERLVADAAGLLASMRPRPDAAENERNLEALRRELGPLQ